MIRTIPRDEDLLSRWREQIAQSRVLDRSAIEQLLLIDSATQCMYVFDHQRLHAHYPVSTSRYGLGCRQGSEQTPIGWHCVAEKIGAGSAPGEVFKGRIAQGWQSASLDAEQRLAQDLITSRILWLRGLEPGLNQGPGCDSHDRYIYIHGSAASETIGRPASIGCIRMLDADVIELFDWAAPGALVFISSDARRPGDPGGDRSD